MWLLNIIENNCKIGGYKKFIMKKKTKITKTFHNWSRSILSLDKESREKFDFDQFWKALAFSFCEYNFFG
jgi:hypothetical protein